MTTKISNSSQTSVPNRKPQGGPRAPALSIDFNGQHIPLPEWSHLRFAKSTLVKLVLIARFFKKLDPVWDSLSPQQKSRPLKKQYYCARSIILCLRRCCGNKLKTFQKRRENPFKHQEFEYGHRPNHPLSNDDNHVSVSPFYSRRSQQLLQVISVTS